MQATIQYLQEHSRTHNIIGLDSGEMPLSLSYWRLLCRVNVDWITRRLMEAIPPVVRKLFEKDTIELEDRLTLPDGESEDRTGIYVFIVKEGETEQGDLILAVYVGSSVKIGILCLLEDPEVRKRENEKQRERYRKKVEEDPEERKRRNEVARKNTKKRMEDPEYRKRRNEMERKRRADPEVREERLEKRRKKMEDPEARKKVAEEYRKKMEDPEARKRRNEMQNKKRADPELRKKYAEQQRERKRKKEDPEEIKKAKEKQKERYNRKKLEEDP
ncbi:hypothetical protein ACN38_g5500 [Penicillium nordicum]|uniref:Uncharacterized protein n=1 Tax=Penicillium nordicum TaxID=229535 RepID=A0A0M8P9N6_9EURO|nr:hypothetical protein ACN38_g5500 [Penicillium nordicum]